MINIRGIKKNCDKKYTLNHCAQLCSDGRIEAFEHMMRCRKNTEFQDIMNLEMRSDTVSRWWSYFKLDLYKDEHVWNQETHHIFKDEEELVVLTDHFLQLYNARMNKQTQALHFSQRQTLFPSMKFALHSFYGHLHHRQRIRIQSDAKYQS